MKINGKQIPKRGSNKKYPILDDLDKLYVALLFMSIGELSKKWEIPANCIRWRVNQYFPQEWKDKIIIERKHKK